MTDTFTPTELTALRANSDADAREWAILQAAKKVADAAVKYLDCDGDFFECGELWFRTKEAVREYRALTEKENKTNE